MADRWQDGRNGEWDGWRNGEWKCPKCGTIIGKNLKGESPPAALVKQHQCKKEAARRAAVPDDYTDNESSPDPTISPNRRTELEKKWDEEEKHRKFHRDDEISKGRMTPGAPLEGLPTPPLARDMANHTGERVRDCFGDWHTPESTRESRMNFEKLVKQVVAESEGAKREREQHELQQQYDSPAWEGDNRRPKPGQQDTDTVRRLDEAKWAAFREMTKLLDGSGTFAKVMNSAYKCDMDNESNILWMSKSIAANDPAARDWFSRLADVTQAFIDAGEAVAEADPDEIRDNGFKPKIPKQE